MRSTARKAFTLIEILIVVVILGILAAIVIPQFTRASDDAQAGNVQSQLTTIRKMVQLYRVRNNGAYPFGTGTLTWGDPAGTTASARGLRGPEFLKQNPLNPRTNSATITAGTRANSEAADAAGGWFWDNTAREIYAARWNETTRVWTDAVN
jgi:general secretion pathway protein G